MAKTRGYQAKSLEIAAGTKPEPGGALAEEAVGRSGWKTRTTGSRERDQVCKAEEQMTEDSTAAHCSCSNSRLCFKGDTNAFRNERHGGIGKKRTFHSQPAGI